MYKTLEQAKIEARYMCVLTLALSFAWLMYIITKALDNCIIQPLSTFIIVLTVYYLVNKPSDNQQG